MSSNPITLHYQRDCIKCSICFDWIQRSLGSGAFNVCVPCFNLIRLNRNRLDCCLLGSADEIKRICGTQPNIFVFNLNQKSQTNVNTIQEMYFLNDFIKKYYQQEIKLLADKWHKLDQYIKQTMHFSDAQNQQSKNAQRLTTFQRLSNILSKIVMNQDAQRNINLLQKLLKLQVQNIAKRIKFDYEQEQIVNPKSFKSNQYQEKRMSDLHIGEDRKTVYSRSSSQEKQQNAFFNQGEDQSQYINGKQMFKRMLNQNTKSGFLSRDRSRIFDNKQNMINLGNLPLNINRSFSSRLNHKTKRKLRDSYYAQIGTTKDKIFQKLSRTQTNPVLYRIMLEKIFEAYTQTSVQIQKGCIELSSKYIGDIQIWCYLDLFNWKNIHTLKLTKVGLTDQQFFVLMEFLDKEKIKIENLAVTNNQLTEDAYEILQQKVKSKAVANLKNLYMSNNHIYQPKVRKIIKKLKNYFTLYQ